MSLIRLDGPLGSRLTEQGFNLTHKSWSAQLLREAPTAISALHQEYAPFCDIIRANTFRCTERASGADWLELARIAVQLARESASPRHRVAASVGPLEDCYRPDLAPQDAGIEHGQFARAVAPLADLFICETFPNCTEALQAVTACVETGKETWISFSAGPDGTLLTPQQVQSGARACVEAGASTVLVNCIAKELTLSYIEALVSCGVPFGAYANASVWNAPPCSPEEYVTYAKLWRNRGATIFGTCCGTNSSHLAALDALV